MEIVETMENSVYFPFCADLILEEAVLYVPIKVQYDYIPSLVHCQHKIYQKEYNYENSTKKEV